MPQRRALRGLLLLTACAVACLSTERVAAVVLPVEAKLTFELATLPPLVSTSYGSATVNGSGGGIALSSLALAAGVVDAGPLLMPVTDPAQQPISGWIADVSNGTGSFATGGGVLGGVLPLAGLLRLCVFGSGSCLAPVANLSVPLNVIGSGGSEWSTGAVNLTVFGAPWTSGTVSIGTITRMGYASGPASAAGSTAQTGGRLQLVTPVHISTNIGASVVIPSFATLTLHFVPEPTTALLLSAGIAGLGWASARRR